MQRLTKQFVFGHGPMVWCNYTVTVVKKNVNHKSQLNIVNF